MVEAVISAGTNLGNRLKNLNEAENYLKEKVKIKRRSDIYKTYPVEVKDHSYYYNMIFVVETDLKLEDFHKYLVEIEDKIGHKRRKNKVLPRKIDLDIIFWNDDIIKNDTLCIPHKKYRKRLFVLKPLMDIEWGNYKDPETEKNIEFYYDKIKGQKVEKI